MRQGEQEAFSTGERGQPTTCRGFRTVKELETRLAVGPRGTVRGRFQPHVVKHSDSGSFRRSNAIGFPQAFGREVDLLCLSVFPWTGAQDLLAH